MIPSRCPLTCPGPGTHPREEEYRGFLQLTGTLLDAEGDGRDGARDGASLVLSEASASIKIEGAAAYSKAMRSHTAR